MRYSLLISLVAVSTLTAQIPRASTGRPAVAAMGDSVASLINRLIIGGALDEKGEFETSEHFKSKRDSLVHANGKKMLLVAERDSDEFVYDADSSSLHMKLSAIGRKIDIEDEGSLPTFVIASNLVSARSYVGSNAFGVKKTIFSAKYNQYEIAMADDSGYDFPENTIGTYKTGTFDPMERDVPMTATRAKSLKPYLRFAFYGNLKDGRVLLHTESNTATISSPYETERRCMTAIFTVEEIRVVDSRTGATITDATRAINVVGP